MRPRFGVAPNVVSGQSSLCAPSCVSKAFNELNATNASQQGPFWVISIDLTVPRRRPVYPLTTDIRTNAGFRRYGPKWNELQPITAFAEEQFLNEYDLNFSINSFDLGHELFLMNIATLSNRAGWIVTFRDASRDGFVLPTACNEFVYRCILRSRQWLRARKFLLRVGDGYS
jgi:hypothetical protein